jgi:acetyl-CoA carboxylase carboxyl transferase subunit beta
MGARAWLDAVLDPVWVQLFDDVRGGDPLSFPGYREQLERAREATGCSESVVVARGEVDGRAVVAFAFEFGFLGGSMGAAAGERICRAFELGAAEGLPVVALTASGGARMQEGMHALAQMPATLGARARLAEAHVPFVAYLRNPTTGGVYASFASTADLVWADPSATIGFAGPRVAETFTGEPLPPGSHTARAALEAGLVDALEAPEGLRTRLADALGLLVPDPLDELVAPAAADCEAARPRGGEAPSGGDAWDAVRAARAPQDVPEFAQPLASGPGARAGLDRFGGRACVVVAHTGVPLRVADYRGARRALAIAERLRLPFVTLVNTPGADPSAASEREGIAREIARTFQAMLAARTPTVACVVGEGGSGGALAFATADRVLIERDAYFSVIAPEGAASILRRDDVERVARDLKLGPFDLQDLGFADLVVETGARADAVAWALAHIGAEPDPHARAERWRVLRR